MTAEPFFLVLNTGRTRNRITKYNAMGRWQARAAAARLQVYFDDWNPGWTVEISNRTECVDEHFENWKAI